jgi:hypothetical protein
MCRSLSTLQTPPEFELVFGYSIARRSLRHPTQPRLMYTPAADATVLEHIHRGAVLQQIPATWGISSRHLDVCKICEGKSRHNFGSFCTSKKYRMNEQRLACGQSQGGIFTLALSRSQASRERGSFSHVIVNEDWSGNNAPFQMTSTWDA